MTEIGKGDEKAFAELFEKHSALVLGYAMRIVGGNLPLAEDISQSTWIKVAKAASSYEKQGQFVAWLRTLTRNTAFNELRQIKHRAEEELDDEILSQQEAQPAAIEAALTHSGDVKKVQETLDQLPENQRMVLVLWMTDEMSYAEIAKQLDLTVSSVKSLIFRARKKLESLVSKAELKEGD